jgi:hypothetical protein
MYTKWEAHIVTSDGLYNKNERISIGVHHCSEQDWERFYESNESDKRHI